MYGIIVKNRGIWGGLTKWVKRNGEIMLFTSKEEAEKEADRIRERSGHINNFNSYFVKEYNA